MNKIVWGSPSVSFVRQLPLSGSLLALCNHRPKACPERGGGNERQRIDGGVASGLLIFPSTPQSPVGDSSPSGEPFGIVQSPPKSLPERGGGNERQRIDGGVATELLIFPSTPQSPCGDSSPSGEPFGLCNSSQKPALKGEVAMSDSELTEGLHRGCSFFRQPLSRHAATAPRPGSLLVCAITNPKAVPASGESGTKCRKGCGLGGGFRVSESRRG